MPRSADPEIAAMTAITRALDDLPEDAQVRVLTWARSRYPQLGTVVTSQDIVNSVAEHLGDRADSAD